MSFQFCCVAGSIYLLKIGNGFRCSLLYSSYITIKPYNAFDMCLSDISQFMYVTSFRKCLLVNSLLMSLIFPRAIMMLIVILLTLIFDFLILTLIFDI